MTWLRTAFLALLGYWTIRLGSGAASGCPLDLVNLAFHEAGHLFLTPFGETMHFLGGTLGQLAVPAGLVFYFLAVKRQPFAAAVCAWWIGENLINIAVYMADARDLALPLVGGGHHDWNTLFYTFGLLSGESVRFVSTSTHVTGAIVMIAGLAWGASFLLSGGLRERFEAFVRDRAPALRMMFVAD
jgi:hypothetical protein